MTLSLSLSASAQDPNVLMIVLDDLNDYLQVLDGHPQASTPNMDALAAQGILFTNAHSNAPLCKPSRASFMRGILPTTSGFFGNNNTHWHTNTILNNSKTLPEYFSENGYTTYKAGKITHTTRDENIQWDIVYANSLNYGPFANNGNENVIHPNAILAYAELTGPLDGTTAKLSDIPNVLPDGSNPGYNGWKSNDLPFNYVDENNRDLMPDEDNVAWIQNHIETLDAANSTDPFFMAIGIVRPHSPFVVPDKYFDMFPIESVQIPLMRRNDRDDTYHPNGTTGYELFETLDHSYTDRQLALRKKVQAYLACVAFADDMVGQLIESLDNSDYADNTVVMLFSDHGYHVGEKQYLRKHAPWEESTRVPFIIRHPDYTISAGETVDHPISLVDVFPTLKDLCNLSGDTKRNANGAELDGASLQPFLANPNTNTWSGSDVALSVIYNWGANDTSGQNLTIRSKKYRYTRYPLGDEELYDHTQDPHEWKNVAGESDYESIRSAMSNALTAISTPPGEPLEILTDHLADDSKMESYSNLNFVQISNEDFDTYDQEQMQRPNLSDGEIIYDATNVHTFKVDFWGIKNKTLTEVGTIKAYGSTDNVNYNEIALTNIEDTETTGYRKRYFFSPTSTISGLSKLKIVVTGGDAAWKAVIGKVRLFDNGSTIPDYSYIDDLVVSADPSLFNFQESDLRTNDPLLPNFSDPLADNSNFYSASGDYYFSNISPENYGDDANRLVRSNINPVADNPDATPTPLKIVYDVNDLTYFRMEFWTNASRTLEQINTETGVIQAYTSENLDSDVDYTEIPIKLIKIKTVGSLMQYAIVPKNEIQGNPEFLKITVTGGTNGKMFSAHYGAMHLYNNTLAQVVLSNNDFSLENNTIYPNPTNGKLYITQDKTYKTLRIFNAIGQLVYQDSEKSSLDISHLKTGIYYLKLDNQNAIRIIKQD